MNLIRKAVITGLGAGYLPAPGTWGSLGPALIFVAANYIFFACSASHSWQIVVVNSVIGALVLLSSTGCVVLGKSAERIFGEKDPQQCTIDEWAGQSMALLFLPMGNQPWQWWAAAGAAFAAFRFFDIVKPSPARQMEKLPYGWGVLLDDIVAGVYANIATRLILGLGIYR